MRIAYLAGPYRSPHGPSDHWTVQQNIQRAADWGRFIAKACGGEVHVHVPQLATAHFSGPDIDEQQWLDGCFALIRRFDIKQDALLVMPGSDRSSGTQAEIRLAHSLGLRVIYLPELKSQAIPILTMDWVRSPAHPIPGFPAEVAR